MVLICDFRRACSASTCRSDIIAERNSFWLADSEGFAKASFASPVGVRSISAFVGTVFGANNQFDDETTSPHGNLFTGFCVEHRGARFSPSRRTGQAARSA